MYRFGSIYDDGYDEPYDWLVAIDDGTDWMAVVDGIVANELVNGNGMSNVVVGIWLLELEFEADVMMNEFDEKVNYFV